MRGYVHVEIAAQQANVTTLKAFNAVRYASMSIPSGQQTSEIIAQVGVLIKSNLSNGPLAPLSVRKLVMEGTSQASAVLRTYQAQKHFQERMADGSAIMDGQRAAEHSTARCPPISGASCQCYNMSVVTLLIPSLRPPRPVVPAGRSAQ